MVFRCPTGGCHRIWSAATLSADGILTENIPDNLILRLAYELLVEGEPVIFVSKDINARLKADALGLQAVDYEKEKINFDDLYSSYSEVEPPVATINGFFKERVYKKPKLGTYPNEFVMMRERTNRKHKKTARARVVELGVTHLSPDLYLRTLHFRAVCDCRRSSESHFARIKNDRQPSGGKYEDDFDG